MQYCSGKKDDENGKSSILKVCWLHLHGSELDSPADR